MSNKVKRQVSGSETAVLNTAVAAKPSLIRATTEFKPDYTPIIRDLKRIGILACSFFVILVGLSFFIK